MTPIRERSATDPWQIIAELQGKLDAKTAECDEALAQQTAAAEVLQVINSSPGDLAPVFDAILEKAHVLCGADKGSLTTYDGEHFRAVATRGLSEPYVAILRAQAKPPGSPPDRLLQGEPLVHVPDIGTPEFTIPRAAAEMEGVRTVLYSPLRRDGALLGYITAYRLEIRPFTDKQIALLQSFAAQAVIAIENARLITETREALEQQTATAEVLQVINSSPGNLTPVFDAILEKAHSLCGISSGGLVAIEGERYRPLAVRGEPRFVEHWLQQGWIKFATDAPAQLRRGEPVHISDVTLSDGPSKSEQLSRLIELGGIRVLLMVPLRKDDVLFGAITAIRNEARPFSDKEIALLENFAAQAVIAMENARLLTETREALEQQTATAEVLQVINSSPGDLTPVFEAMLDRAMRLEAAFGILWTYDGEWLQAAAIRGATAAYADFLTSAPHKPGAENAHGRLLGGERFVQIADAEADAAYQSHDPLRRATVELGGARTLLAVPLRKDGVFLGDVVIYRRHVQLFSEKQIALLQSFAAQAVIAIENARLLGELRERTHDLEESLEYQTATSDVLKVISRSNISAISRSAASTARPILKRS